MALHVHSESRGIALEEYTLATHDDTHDPSIPSRDIKRCLRGYVDFKSEIIDILHFALCHGVQRKIFNIIHYNSFN